MEKSISNILEKRINQHNNYKEESYEMIPTSFPSLNKKLDGFKKGEVIVIAGRPSMGTTTLLLQLATEMATNSKILFNSLQHDEQWISDKLISIIEGQPFQNIRTGKFKKEGFRFPLEPSLTNEEFKSCDVVFYLKNIEKLKNLIVENKYDLVFIDWLQQLKDSENNEESVIIIQELKQLAKKNDICIILSSTVSWEVEYRGGDCRPKLSDLRCPETMEDFLDKVFMLYRPEVYGITEDYEGNANVNSADLYLVKNNSGKLYEFPLRTNDDFTKFYDREYLGF
jgi:replicative DNA helicase